MFRNNGDLVNIYKYLTWMYDDLRIAYMYGVIERYDRIQQDDKATIDEIRLYRAKMSEARVDKYIKTLLDAGFIAVENGVYTRTDKLVIDFEIFYSYCNRKGLDFDSRSSFVLWVEDNKIEPFTTIMRIKEEKILERKRSRLERLQNKEKK